MVCVCVVQMVEVVQLVVESSGLLVELSTGADEAGELVGSSLVPGTVDGLVYSGTEEGLVYSGTEEGLVYSGTEEGFVYSGTDEDLLESATDEGVSAGLVKVTGQTVVETGMVSVTTVV